MAKPANLEVEKSSSTVAVTCFMTFVEGATGGSTGLPVGVWDASGTAESER